jgi:hypothetical protein
MQPHCRGFGIPCTFGQVAQYSRYRIEYQQPPCALAAIMQPLGMESEAPQ